MCEILYSITTKMTCTIRKVIKNLHIRPLNSFFVELFSSYELSNEVKKRFLH